MNDGATFLFADIAGFTALTEAHGDEQAADLAGDFEQRVREAAPGHGGEFVKAIGDALMLRVPDAAQAVELGLAIADELMRDHGEPSVRVGMHHGAAIARGTDWFGSTVNVAARVSGIAAGGEVLLTDAVRERAGEPSAVIFEARGRHRLRNVREPLMLFAALREGEPADRGLVLDPVCRMAVDPARAAGRLVHGGAVHFFCSLECAAAFAREPGAFAGN